MKRLVFPVLIFISITSCISNKRINYLQNLEGNEPIEMDEFIPFADVEYEYILQPYDIVDVDFASSNEDLLKAFQYQGANAVRTSRAGGNGNMDIFIFGVFNR